MQRPRADPAVADLPCPGPDHFLQPGHNGNPLRFNILHLESESYRKFLDGGGREA